ncbi:hypothetical protein MBBAR_5c01160 [Methanobrevibacter arboriphilus JCM 13429 = DSM 1125]|uniref:Uncharacterized protein n=1 Tax=Methanobrevibacter arboriphilus JCM 13429 = DSM 1125 TaxID=1300164 RepID=A0A1V6N3W1_METAZ|nr:hypothetical protein [Methanobrevibacter arboriphilus]OQD59273.1 hypothetical protein MBBAR_5c01160 [Methanobrevibacter arboriphilus JCM 13429 = DSM 1125]
MSEIADNVIFKKDSGEKINVLQKYVGLKARQGGILTVNFRTPNEDMDQIKHFFEGMKASEAIKYNIGETGDVDCYFKGVAPLLKQIDEAGFEYSFLSVTLQELKKDYDDDIPNGCSC